MYDLADNFITLYYYSYVTNRCHVILWYLTGYCVLNCQQIQNGIGRYSSHIRCCSSGPEKPNKDKKPADKELVFPKFLKDLPFPVPDKWIQGAKEVEEGNVTTRCNLWWMFVPCWMTCYLLMVEWLLLHSISQGGGTNEEESKHPTGGCRSWRNAEDEGEERGQTIRWTYARENLTKFENSHNIASSLN